VEAHPMTASPLPLPDQAIARVSRLTLKNFKSFDDAAIDLPNLTILIGPNASGKSNLLSAFSFLKDIMQYGLDDAVSIQGGIDAVRCLYIPRSEPIDIGLRIELPGRLREPHFSFLVQPVRDEETRLSRRVQYRNLLIDYRFRFIAAQRTRRLRILSEELSVAFEFATEDRTKPPSLRDLRTWHSSRMSLSTTNGQLKVGITTPTAAPSLRLNEYRIAELQEAVKDQRDPIIRYPTIALAFDGFSLLSKMFKYDVDPKLGKNAIPVTGRTELEEDGDNLAAALRVILNKKSDREMLLDLVTDALSFVKTIDVATFADMTRFLRIKERYNPRQAIPGNLLSDGTVSVLTLIIALYFQSSQLTIFEEPDRGLHPALTRKIAVMIQEQSAIKQILVSTHSPDFIDAVSPDLVQCTLRDSAGYTRLFKPSESSLMQDFVKAMGIGRVYADNLMKA
jgi:predicted ATPase